MLTLARVALAVILQCGGIGGAVWALFTVNGLLALIVLVLGVVLGAVCMPEDIALGVE